jgi:hypothetical protein
MRTDENKPVGLVLKQVRLCDDGRKSHNTLSMLLKEEDFLVEMGRSIKKLSGFVRLGSVDRKLNLRGLCG